MVTEEFQPNNEVPESISEETMEFIEQDKFQLDSIGKITSLILLCAAICVGLCAIYIILSPIRSPDPVYFQATEAQQLIHDVPLNQSNLPNNVLFNWVAESMMTAHTFNYINYETIFENSREYFTPDGFESFLTALKDNKIIDDVITNKYVLRGVPTNAPQITKEGLLANFYLWKIKIPMILRYRNVDTDRSSDAEITLLIVRVPTTDAPIGIRILKYDLLIKSI